MLGFLFGVAVGALGFWGYRQFMPGESGQEFSWSTNNQASTGSGQIIRPTAEEVAGRPAEPLPGGPSSQS